ncbi:MAG TPA: CapA family protein, partial [Symbiobacteriaceae bacterium]|nr:CapA family protein [Symbiobacteriaceae bacterium]
TRLAFMALTLTVLTGCTFGTPTKATPPEQTAQVEHTPAPLPPEPAPVHARILAVGDLLMHTPLVFSSELPGGEWDFKPLFEPVRPWIEGADLAIAELETTLTGTDYPWSGYPSFNTPPELARDIKAIGFDAVTNANNHALDYDIVGLRNTADNLDRYGVFHTGTNRTPEEQEQILVLEVAPTIRMALLSYTYGTNGIPLPNPWNVNMLDPERIRSDIRRARQMTDVDLVAVALHFGQEYARTPDEEQQQYVRLSLDAGADIIFGDHPHVIQPIEVRHVIDEFGRARRRAVIFSFGNFISNQEGLHREAGLMFLVDVKKAKGETMVEQVSFVPTWVHGYSQNGVKRYRVVAVEKAMKDYETKADPLITPADYERLKAVWADTTVQAVGSPEVVLVTVDQPVKAAAER